MKKSPVLLGLILAMLASQVRSDSYFVPCAQTVQSVGTATLPISTTDEITLFTYTAQKVERWDSLMLRLAALATTTTCLIKVYYTPAGGTSVKLNLPLSSAGLTGIITWTLATDADNFYLPLGLGAGAGDALSVTAQVALGEAAQRSIPYAVTVLR